MFILLFHSEIKKWEICPSFSSFHFTSWKVGDEDSFCGSSHAVDEDDDLPQEHAFDINAVPEPLDDEPNNDEYAGKSK